MKGNQHAALGIVHAYPYEEIAMAKQTVSKQVAEKLAGALLKGEKDSAVAAAQAAIDSGVDPVALIQEVIVPTLTEVGDRFEKLEIFLPELMAAGVAGTACSAVIEEAIAKQGRQMQSAGTVVLGTVKGDIHDIGKNIVASLLKAHGYRVIDIGKDTPAKAFIAAAEENKADVIAASALMSITRAGCREVADLLREVGLKDKYPLVVGGGSIDQAYADEIGASGYSPTAAGAVELVHSLVKKTG
jgi:5-methyltetrahydrofolate--homocysteine methyltransferase